MSTTATSSSSDDGDVKSIRILEYDGDGEYWDEWSEKTLAIASVRGWDDALTHSAKLPDASMTDAKEQKLLKNNKAAYNYLLLSCKGAAFKLVRNKKKHAGIS